MITVSDLTTTLTNTIKQVSNINIPPPTATGPADQHGNPSLQQGDIEPLKDLFASRAAAILAPAILDMVTNLAQQVALDTVNQQIAPLIQRIQRLESQVFPSSPSAITG